jgi:glucokinase
MKHLIAGVDIGGTKTAVVLSLQMPHVLTRIEFPTLAQQGPEQAIRNIMSSLEAALEQNNFVSSDIASIGVSCGGPLDSIAGVVQSPPNLPGWDNIPICSLLSEHFGAPAYLENDANAGALAEFRFGAGVGTKNFAFLTMGTGFGAGLILNGQLYTGSTFSAGEIGHVRLSAEGPVGYGKAGSVEGWASGGGMAQSAVIAVRSAQDAGRATSLAAVLASNGVITGKDVAVAAADGDAVAHEVVAMVGRRLGEALAILIDVLDPDCIAIGGLALRFGEGLLGPAREVVQQEALESPRKHCRVVPAKLSEEIGDIAALCVGLDGFARSSA